MEKKEINRKFGLEPGAIIYTGEKDKDHPTFIQHYKYNENSHEFKEDVKVSELDCDKNIVNWINIEGIHDTEIIKDIGEKFNIDNFVLEDIVNISQRPKVDEKENFVFIVVKMLRFSEEDKEIIAEQVSIIVSPNYLISFQEEKGDVFETIRNRIKSGDWIRKKNHDYLAYSILDAILDNYFVVLDYMEEIIDTLEVKLIKTSDTKDLETIIDLKNQTIILKKAIAPIRDLVIKLQHLESRLTNLTLMEYYLSDLQDHAVIIHENMENISSRVLNLFSIYHSSINNSMNERMKVLTIVSTIFVPLTFLAGVYGMNFENMPELQWAHGYFFIVGIMCLIGAGMLYFFKRKRWI